MTNLNADGDLLLGILALQNGLVDQADLIAAFQVWSRDRSRPLASVLADRGALSGEGQALLDGLVRLHLQRYGPDPEASLAAVGAGATIASLRKAAGPTLGDLLDGVSIPPLDPPREPTAEEEVGLDATATATWGVGQPTSGGGRFRILRPHARGGLGLVSVALDDELHREVALKQIEPERADDPVSRARFLVEAEVTGRLEHPGVVPVYGLGADEAGRPYYAMRFVRGETLKEAIERFHAADAGAGRDPAARSLELRKLLGRFVSVCEAVGYAHSRGVIHRDIKPANILLGPFGETLLVDWGLAKVVGREESTRASAAELTLRPEGGSDSSETVAGAAVGTPAYMSPEQAEGRLGAAAPPSDVYSLGATLYALLVGKPAFEGRDAAAILPRVRRGDFPPPRQVNRRVPAALEAVILKAMAARPESRYKSARALGEELEHWMADEPVSARREPWHVRLARWGRRNRPLVAAAIGIAVIAGLASEVARLRTSNRIIKKARAGADQARASEEATHYFKKIILAEREWTDSNVGRAEGLLEDCPAPLRGWEWRYLKRACHTDLFTIRAHDGMAHAVAVHPDGKTLASAGEDGKVKIWDATTREFVREFAGHTTAIWGLAFSRDGRWLASASGSNSPAGEVKVWDMVDGREHRSFPGVTGYCSDVTFRSDGLQVLASSGDLLRDGGRITIWDLATGETVGAFRNPARGLHDAAFSPDGHKIVAAVGTLDSLAIEKGPGAIEVRDAKTGQVELTLPGHEGPATGAAFSPDGKRIASCSWDKTIRVWDAVTQGPPLMTLRGHTQMVTRVVYSPDGSRLASASEDNSIRIWDAASGRELAVLRGHAREVYGLSFFPDGSRLASAGLDGMVKVWDVSSGERAGRLGHRVAEINGIAFSPDDRRVALACGDKTVRVIPAEGGEAAMTLHGHKGAVWGVRFSPDGRFIASAGGDWREPDKSGEVRLWDGASGRPLWDRPGHAGLAWKVEFSRDGKIVASGGGERRRPGEVILWDVESGRELLTLKTGPRGTMGVAISPGGGRIAESGGDGTIRIWNRASRRLIRDLEGHTHVVNCVAYSPKDGRLIASSSYDGTARIWDANTGALLHTLKGHKSSVNDVALSPDGLRLATCSDDSTVKVWDVATGQEALTLRGHDAMVRAVAFSHDGTRLASAGFDGTVRIWDTRPIAPR